MVQKLLLFLLPGQIDCFAKIFCFVASQPIVHKGGVSRVLLPANIQRYIGAPYAEYLHFKDFYDFKDFKSFMLTAHLNLIPCGHSSGTALILTLLEITLPSIKTFKFTFYLQDLRRDAKTCELMNNVCENFFLAWVEYGQNFTLFCRESD